MASRAKMTGCFMVALTALGVGGCEGPPTPLDAGNGPAFAAAIVITGMRGTGAIGSGQPTFAGVDRQTFDLDVGISGGVVYGRLDYVDYGFLKEDGNYPHFVVGPAWDGTRIASFVQTSTTCAAFDGVGRLLNTDELLAFRVETCDEGQPGVGRDIFGIYVPQRLVTHGGIYKAGPLPLADGELTASGAPTPTLGLP